MRTPSACDASPEETLSFPSLCDAQLVAKLSSPSACAHLLLTVEVTELPSAWEPYPYAVLDPSA